MSFHALYSTPIGILCIEFSGNTVTRLKFDAKSDYPKSHLPKEVMGPLDEYFKGAVNALDCIAVNAEGTLFQKRVWSLLRTIPAGETLAYGDVAARLNSHARAVGSANRSNPVALIVPCHRVIAKTGALHGYAGGLERKKWLLRHEGFQCDDSIVVQSQTSMPRATI